MLYNALMCDGVEEDAPDMDTMHLSAPLPLPSANERTAPEGGDQKSSYEICREKTSTTTTTTSFCENLTCVEDKEGWDTGELLPVSCPVKHSGYLKFPASFTNKQGFSPFFLEVFGENLSCAEDKDETQEELL